MTTKISYKKLRDGSWGVAGAGLTAGARVTVTKRSGDTKTETVDRILWADDGYSIATIATNDRRRAGPGAGPGCNCDDECCSRGCRCESHCCCRGGPIHDC